MRPEPADGIETLRRRVPPHWLDANGHMNEARYLQAFSRASDALLDAFGADAAYIAAGRSFFTVETHLRHLAETLADETIVVRSRILSAEGVRLRVFQRLDGGDGRARATAEHLFLHVDLATRRACPPGPQIAARLAALAAAMAGPWPEGAGRAIGDPR